jgi:hypothetical protein
VYYTGDLTLDRLTTQFNLAGVLDDMGEWDEARNLWASLLIRVRGEIMGPQKCRTCILVHADVQPHVPRYEAVIEGRSAELCAGRFHLWRGPFWLRFTYVTPVLVTKRWGWKRLGRGPHHPATLDAVWYLAMMLMDDIREWGTARKLWRQVIRSPCPTHKNVPPNWQKRFAQLTITPQVMCGYARSLGCHRKYAAIFSLFALPAVLLAHAAHACPDWFLTGPRFAGVVCNPAPTPQQCALAAAAAAAPSAAAHNGAAAAALRCAALRLRVEITGWIIIRTGW